MCTADNSILDILALVVSGISIVISVAVAICEIYINKKISNTNLMAELYREIVKVYLTEKFPEAIAEIHFENDILVGIEKLQSELNSFRNRLKFFKYLDLDFYIELKEKQQGLEDYILENADMLFTQDEQNNIHIEVSKSMAEIYAIVNKKYKNG